MKFNLLQTISRYFIVFSISIFLIVAFMGLNSMGTMGSMGQAVRCPFSGHSMSICSMNPLEHIEEWQGVFVTLPIKDNLLLLSTLLFIFALFGLRYFRKFSIHNLSQLKIQNNSFYLRITPVFNYLQEAFSGGILNPKLF